MYRFQVPEYKKIRVILDTDAACEADDQYAIVHALLTPRFKIKGIIAEQFWNSGGEESVEKSFEEIQKLLGLMGKTDAYAVKKGAVRPMLSESDPQKSEGADFIIEEALKEDAAPLYVLCQGAITNLALALVKAPEIADRLICIWIGGAAYPEGGWEFNLMNDCHAANVVFKSSVELWQVPMDGYTRMQVGYAELQKKVYPCGEIGRYLFEEMQALGNSPAGEWTMGESWSLGDSPAIGLALNPGCGHYEVRNAPLVDENGKYVESRLNRRIRVYHEIDSRYILEDFFAKLELFAAI